MKNSFPPRSISILPLADVSALHVLPHIRSSVAPPTFRRVLSPLAVHHHAHQYHTIQVV